MRELSKSCRADPENDGLLVVLTPQAVTPPTEIANRLTSFAKLEGKPILASFMGGQSVAEAMTILDRAGIPTFAYPDSAARAFCYLWQYTTRSMRFMKRRRWLLARKVPPLARRRRALSNACNNPVARC